MESSRVRYELDGSVATLTLDDGGRNLVSPAMLRDLNEALDRAQKDQAVVVLTGPEDVFSAGFDLNVLRTGVLNAFSMIIGGFQLSLRLLSFPMPVVIACNGHAIAMGSFEAGLLGVAYSVWSLGGPFESPQPRSCVSSSHSPSSSVFLTSTMKWSASAPSIRR